MDHVETVKGPIAADGCGRTLMHEHLVIDLRPNSIVAADPETAAIHDKPVSVEQLALLRRNPIASIDNCVLDDLEIQSAELAEFARLGGRTVVDVTPPVLGRDVGALRSLSETTGLNIVAGCGHYTHPCHEPFVATESERQLADRLVADLTVGIDGTGIRAGIIGELGTSDPVHPDEEKVLRAGALAQRETGASIYLHVLSQTGHQLLDTLATAGADLSRVIVGHQDLVLGTPGLAHADAVIYFKSLLARGCVIAFDCCGKTFCLPQMPGLTAPIWTPSDIERARAVKALVDAGYADRILVSHDVCHKADLLRYGGNGYGHILRSFTAALRDVGVPDDVTERILVDNPRTLLTLGTVRTAVAGG